MDKNGIYSTRNRTQPDEINRAILACISHVYTCLVHRTLTLPKCDSSRFDPILTEFDEYVRQLDLII